jgi:hypothetical protein
MISGGHRNYIADTNHRCVVPPMLWCVNDITYMNVLKVHDIVMCCVCLVLAEHAGIKENVVRYISHEIRAPLNTVFMGIQLARK